MMNRKITTKASNGYPFSGRGVHNLHRSMSDLQMGRRAFEFSYDQEKQSDHGQFCHSKKLSQNDDRHEWSLSFHFSYTTDGILGFPLSSTSIVKRIVVPCLGLKSQNAPPPPPFHLLAPTTYLYSKVKYNFLEWNCSCQSRALHYKWSPTLSCEETDEKMVVIIPLQSYFTRWWIILY